MGLISALLGNVSEVDGGKLEREFEVLLVDGERIERAYKLFRDLTVFTNKRLIMVDKQGWTGKKKQVTSIPYKNITLFSKESSGHFDMDAEIKIWVRGMPAPIAIEFRKDRSVHEVYRVLSAFAMD